MKTKIGGAIFVVFCVEQKSSRRSLTHMKLQAREFQEPMVIDYYITRYTMSRITAQSLPPLSPGQRHNGLIHH